MARFGYADFWWWAGMPRPQNQLMAQILASPDYYVSSFMNPQKTHVYFMYRFPGTDIWSQSPGLLEPWRPRTFPYGYVVSPDQP